MPFLVGMVALLVLLYHPSCVDPIRSSLDPRVASDDMRQSVFPFFRDTPDRPVGPDVLGDYHLDIMAAGYRLMYRSLAPFLDPSGVSKSLPFVLFAVTLAAAVRTARLVGGTVAGRIPAVLLTHALVCLREMAAGLSRSFAFPATALGLWSLAAGRVRLLAVLAIVGRAFYPVGELTLGISLVGSCSSVDCLIVGGPAIGLPGIASPCLR